MNRPRHRMRRTALAVAIGVVVSAATLPVTSAAGTDGAHDTSARAGKDGGWQQTRTLTREMVRDSGTVTVDSRTVTVRANRTQDLRGRERVRISWSGAHPSGGRAANPFGESGLAQEYPVVILQCRGVDDPSLPPAKRLSPETCWTSTRQQRTQSAVESAAIWRHDLYATPQEREQKTGVTPYPTGEVCQDVDFLSTKITPFRAANGKVYLSCTAETMAPEAAVGASYPPSEQAAFTRIDGSGEAMFEVRTDIENESLGCNRKTACSIVVIPIMGISCADEDPACTSYGRFPPGSSNFGGLGIDEAVGPSFWWSASNWRNRFSIPIEFSLPPNVCDILDSRAPTAFYGSELMSQAALQWAPAYCLRKDRFKFQHNRMGDAPAFALMENGQAPAAFVSSKRKNDGPDPVAYAPTAVTGFAVSYVIDKPDNAGEYTDLRLTPRLLAKLLTMSYPASYLGRQRPGLEANPLSINQDPEFQAINPGLDTRDREAAATILSLSQSSDVVKTLTAYIARDKEAMSFVNGRPDPWGMKVNPSYKGIDLPVSEWPLRETFVPSSELECLKQNPAVYLNQVAAPVSYLRTIAEAVLDAWPNVQTRCEKATSTDPFRLGRVERQGIGSRMMLGVTSMGDAARFELRTAALETTDGKFQRPDPTSLAAALRHAEQTQPLGPFELDGEALSKDSRAYPGTMVVYTVARTRGLDKADAGRVAQFIRVATTEGQEPGFGNGELPRGFLPLRARGSTAPLVEAARRAADVIAAQDEGDRPQRGGGGGATDGPSGGGPADEGGDTGPVTGALGSTPPDTTPPAELTPAPATTAQQPAVARTAYTTSATARALLPTALFLALLAGLGSAIVRLGVFGRRGAGDLQ